MEIKIMYPKNRDKVRNKENMRNKNMHKKIIE